MLRARRASRCRPHWPRARGCSQMGQGLSEQEGALPQGLRTSLPEQGVASPLASPAGRQVSWAGSLGEVGAGWPGNLQSPVR